MPIQTKCNTFRLLIRIFSYSSKFNVYHITLLLLSIFGKCDTLHRCIIMMKWSNISLKQSWHLLETMGRLVRSPILYSSYHFLKRFMHYKVQNKGIFNTKYPLNFWKRTNLVIICPCVLLKLAYIISVCRVSITL